MGGEPVTPTREKLAEIQATADAATPGPWERRTAPRPGSTESKAEWMAATCVSDDPLQVLISESTDPKYRYLVPALTGDGPTSEANAVFIAAARSAVPELVAALTAVLDLHRPVKRATSASSMPGYETTYREVCMSCEAICLTYPCPTVRTATAALEGGSS